MRSSFLLVCLLVCVGLSSVLGEDAGSRTKYINVGLVSNWGSTPLHMEASEYFAEESTDSFWRFIKTFVNKFESVKTATPQALYSKSLEAAAELLVADKVHLLELSLGLRTYSPKIEMYRQIPKMESDVITTTHVRLGSAVYTTSAELEKAIGALSAKQESSLLFEHDHIFPTQSEVVAHAILYADFADPSFSAFHNVLSAAASQGKVGYVLRHLVPESDTKIDLQGWGVDLAIKNVEYKAMDDSKVSKDKTSEEASVAFDEEEDIAGFRIGVLKKRKPEFAQQLDDFGTFLMGKDVQVGELNVWDFKDMGLQASQKVVTGSDPLRTLRDISQSFPTLAGPLTRLKLNNTLKNEIQHNQNRISEGENLVLLNGRVIDAENLDAFAFLSVLKEEISKVDTLRKLKLGLSSIVPFVSAPLADKLSLRLKLDTESIVFANNLEKDEIYSRWPRSVNDIMRRVYPGQMRFVARNFFTVVLVADLATDEGLEGVTTLISLVNQNLPARVGLLPIVKKGDAASYELAVIVKYLEAKSGGKAVFRFLTQLGQYTAQSSKPLSSSDLATAYSYVSHAYGLGKFNEVVASETAKQEVDKMIEAAQNLGLESNQLFVNGLACDGNKEILDAISEAMSDQTSFLQQYVQQGRINDGTNIYQFLLNPPDYFSRANTVVQRFNKLVPTSESNPLQIVPIATGGLPAGLNRFLEANKDEVKKFSLFLFVDVKNADSVKTALEAIQFVETSQNSRVLVLPNSVSHPEATLVEEAIIKGGNNVAVVKAVLEAQQKSLINGVALTSDEVQQAITTGSNGKKLQVQEMTPQEQRTNYLDWAKNVAGVAVGETAIIINGRKLVLESVFLSKDFEFLELYQDLKYGRVLDVLLREPQFEGVDSDDLTSSFLSTVVMQAASVLAEDEQKGIKRRIISPDMKVSAQQTTSENPSLHIIAVLNPLSKASQKFTPVLITLRKLFAIKIQIYLNPLLQLSDLPLKRYYHYLFTADMEFDEAGQLVSGNTATLSQLPLTRILTLGMDTPEAWLVQPIVARYDLDNIKLEDLGDEKVLQAVFELEYVLVEGNCYDKSTLQWGYPTPPRGLELVLQHTDPNVPSVDTLVMSNFGYFQLKANPGIWKLKLAEGRGSKLFSIAKETTDNSEFRWVTVSSFLGETVDFKVQRQPGMEQAQLLVTEEESEGAWDALSGLWQSKDENGAPATLHIFSVASGHLYERLTRIMMLSVIKQTKNPVKFWFLKNYLSPKFKEIIPHMAKEYNFTYELVTYKWPSWLRKQTEKQRIIWAYKILFLDVLFPLGVKKMIFVDADQVVRTDMMELYNMDLQGAPLAYTPFCNNKPEMDGFRFWKAGYWKDHLRGRPYHISALYVIDLQQFRRTAAGDQLRSTYDMLSRDPNSLANLDQDLPNYLQHNVKIHSLPQEWLWCETWCPEDTKTTAKTIDLCNNPLTKASKLENAVRILGDEWTSLDNEVKELEQKIQQNKSSQPSSSSSSEAHPHSSHTTHEDVSKEKLAEAYSKYKTEL